MPRLDSCCCRGASTGELPLGGRMPGEGIGPLFGDLRDRWRYESCISGLLNTNIPGRYLFGGVQQRERARVVRVCIMRVWGGGGGGERALMNHARHIKLHVVPATTFHADDNTMLVTKRVALQDDLHG
jgi:hypothetical protein